jgi:hypothetical protein
MSDNCEECGAPFERRAVNQRYCVDTKCVKARKRRVALEHYRGKIQQTERVCPYCKESFITNRIDQTLCGKDECKKAHNRKKVNAYNKRQRELPAELRKVSGEDMEVRRVNKFLLMPVI